MINGTLTIICYWIEFLCIPCSMQLAMHPAEDLQPNTINFLMKLKNVMPPVKLLDYLLPSCVEVKKFRLL